MVESFKSNQPEPDYSWEPYYTHAVAKIEVPAQYTQKTASYVKQVIESNKGMYKPEGRLFVSQEDKEPRRFKKNIADCMGAPIKQKVEGLLESLLSQYEQSTTDNDVLELDDAAILAQASSQG